jgi:hypothetical protein
MISNAFHFYILCSCWSDIPQWGFRILYFHFCIANRSRIALSVSLPRTADTLSLSDTDGSTWPTEDHPVITLQVERTPHHSPVPQESRV